MPNWDPRDLLATAAVAGIMSTGKALEAEHHGHLCRMDPCFHYDTHGNHEALGHSCEICSICDRYKCEVE